MTDLFFTGIVREVTDDKSLPKLARKNKQIVHAPHASPKAKLVKHVGKLSSLRDLTFNMSDLFTGIVREVTDDKSLPKLARKNKQIEHAPHASPKAKLVKLADKLYNLRDLKRQTPNGWTSERVQEYFEWAAKVVAGLRGSNKVIEDELDKLFRERNIPLN